MEKLTHPVLKMEELIIGYRDEMGVEIRKDDFTNPAPDFWYNVYLAIAAKILGFTPQELQEKLRTASGDLEYASVYDGLILNLRLMFLIRRILCETNSRNVEEFDLLSIKRPTKKSAILYLSSLLNFMRFQIMMKDEKDALLDTERTKNDRNALLKEKLHSLQQKVSKLKADKNTVEKVFEEYQIASADIRKNVIAKKAKIEDLKNVYVKFDRDMEDQKSNMERKNSQYEELKNRLENAQMKIVQSPMRLQHDIQIHMDRYTELQKEYNEKRAEYSSSREQVRILTEVTEEMVVVGKILEELEATIGDIKEKKQLLLKKQTEREECSSHFSILKEKEIQMNEINISKRKELYDMKLDHENRIASAIAKFVDIKKDTGKKHEMLKANRGDEFFLVEKKEKTLIQMDDERKKAKEVCDKIMKKATLFCESMIKEVFEKTGADIEREVDKWLSEN